MFRLMMISLLFASAFSSRNAHAHFLFIHLDRPAEAGRIAEVFFSEFATSAGEMNGAPARNVLRDASQHRLLLLPANRMKPLLDTMPLECVPNGLVIENPKVTLVVLSSERPREAPKSGSHRSGTACAAVHKRTDNTQPPTICIECLFISLPLVLIESIRNIACSL